MMMIMMMIQLVDDRGCRTERLISEFSYNDDAGTAEATIYSMFKYKTLFYLPFLIIFHCRFSPCLPFLAVLCRYSLSYRCREVRGLYFNKENMVFTMIRLKKVFCKS